MKLKTFLLMKLIKFINDNEIPQYKFSFQNNKNNNQKGNTVS